MKNPLVKTASISKARTLALFTALALTAAACGADATATESPNDDSAETPQTQEATETAEAASDDVADANLGDPQDLALSFDGLEPLGDTHNYEAWVVVDGEPVTAGIFDIDDAGKAATNQGEPAKFVSYEGATDVVISIEPQVDDDPAPAATKILGGALDEEGNVELSIDHPAALATDFSDASGSYILATPTTETTDDENSGVWFLSLPGPEQSLSLPDLPEGWVYEGWAVVDGTPLSTGRFTSASGADDFNAFSGDGDAPPYPGEDFVSNAPDGLTFPIDLSGGNVVISVEPDTDNSEAPFTLKPLVAEVPQTTEAIDHMNFQLETKPGGITGTGIVG